MPDGLITAMGTEVLIFDDEDESVSAFADRDWQRRFDGWDRGEIVDVLRPFGRFGVKPHRDEFQARFKVSFSVPHDLRERCADAVRSLPQTSRIVVSGKSDFDVLPATAGKGAATLFVADTLGIDIPNRLMVAGDSANDVDMFEVSSRGIVVGNARQELLDRTQGPTAFRSTRPRGLGILDGLRYWGALSQNIEAPE